MELVDCRILRCHATALGGGLYNEVSHVTMTRVNISECSARAAGGIYTNDFAAVAALVDVLVTSCRATGEDEDDGGGGILVDGGALVTMTGGAIRDCAAQSYGGGLRVNGGASQVRLRGIALQGCTAPTRASRAPRPTTFSTASMPPSPAAASAP